MSINNDKIDFARRSEEFLKYKDSLFKEPGGDFKKEYYVGCYSEDDWKYVHEILMQDGTLEDNIPSNSCECINDCLHSKTRGIYLLNDAEAEQLRNHPRVHYVHVNTQRYPGTYLDNPDDIATFSKQDRYSNTVKNQRYTTYPSTGIAPYAPTTPLDSSLLNRGGYQLKRHQQRLNPWSSSIADIFDDEIQQYGDGSDIDIIVCDQDMWFGHIEFQNRYEYGTSEFDGNETNIGELVAPKGYRGGNVLPGNGSCDLLDLVLDAPYYLDPDFFNADPNTRLMTRWDGTIVPVESYAKNWWSQNSLTYRSARFVSQFNGGTAVGVDDFGSISINSSYTRARCNGSNTAYHTGTGFHGTPCASLAYGRQYGWAYNANKWFLNMYGSGANSVETGFDLQKIFHQIKPVNPAYGTKNPTISSNSWAYRQEVRENYNNIDEDANISHIYEFSLDTNNWDVSSSSLAGVTTSPSIKSQEPYPSGMFFKPEGDKCYIIGSRKILFEYDITNWDISTLTYSEKSISLVNELSGVNVHGIFFKPEGDKLCILTSDSVREFTLSNWVINTIQQTNNKIDISNVVQGDLFFKPDGKKLYVAHNNGTEGSTSSNKIYQYDLDVAWNITSAVYASQLNIGNRIVTGVYFDGTGVPYTLYSTSTTGDQSIFKWNISVPWDIGSSITYNSGYFMGSTCSNPQSLFFNPDGSKYYVISDTKFLKFNYKYRDENWQSFSVKTIPGGYTQTYPNFMNYYYPDGFFRRRVFEVVDGHQAITAGRELIESGVIFIAAAGNNNQKLVKSDHPDYSNYHSTFAGLPFEESTTPSIYSTINNHPAYNSHNRPGFPIQISKDVSGDYKCIIVGALDDFQSGGLERKTNYSNMGNAVDCFFSADDVLSAKDNKSSGFPRYDNYYYLNGSKSVISEDRRFDGTSAACPVCAGFIATKLQYNREWTIDNVKNWISGLDPSEVLLGTEATTSSDTNWNSPYNMQGNVGIIPYDDALTGNEPATSAEISSISDVAPTEGDTITIQISTDLVSGTYYYSIEPAFGTSISSSDFANDSLTGSFVVSGGIGTITIQLAENPNKEGTERFRLRIRESSESGKIIATSEYITISDVFSNQAPINIELSSTSFNENIASGTVVATISATDPDIGETLTYSLVFGTGSTDNASFTITGNELKINSSPDYETKSSYNIRIQTTDSGGLTYEKSFTLTVNDNNEAPTDITLNSTSFSENIAPGTAVATISAADPDTGDTLTYSLVDGDGSTDNDDFIIDGNELKIASSPDYETKSSYSIRIKATDFDGLAYEKSFTLSVNNLNESPTDITLSSTSFNENIASGTVVATISATDPDGDTLTYSLVGGADDSYFTITGNELKINSSPDYETKSSYSIRIGATDSRGLTYEKSFTLSVNDINEPPSSLTLSSTSFDENIAAGTTVATLSTNDPDIGETLTYSLVFGTGSTDNASFAIDGDKLKINSSPDYETKSSYNIRIQVVDSNSRGYVRQFTLTVNEINESPTDITLSSTSFNENIASGTVVATISATDPDIGDTLTYTLVSGTGDTDNASFTITGNELKINSSPDYETKSSYSIRIGATDSRGLTSEETFTLSVSGLNEAPTDITLSSTSFSENIFDNTTVAVATISATDPDIGDTLTYTLVSGTGDTDNASFTITGNELKINPSPDYETKSSYSIRIRATDSGGLTYEKSFTLSVKQYFLRLKGNLILRGINIF